MCSIDYSELIIVNTVVYFNIYYGKVYNTTGLLLQFTTIKMCYSISKRSVNLSFVQQVCDEEVFNTPARL